MIHSILDVKGCRCPRLTLVPYPRNPDVGELKALSKKESGTWLNTLRGSFVATLLYNICFRISIDYIVDFLVIPPLTA